MIEKLFNVGDVVKLKGGSTEMEVTGYYVEKFVAASLIKRKEIEPEETDLVVCKYFDKNLKKYMTKKVKQDELELVGKF